MRTEGSGDIAACKRSEGGWPWVGGLHLLLRQREAPLDSKMPAFPFLLPRDPWVSPSHHLAPVLQWRATHSCPPPPHGSGASPVPGNPEPWATLSLGHTELRLQREASSWQVTLVRLGSSCMGQTPWVSGAFQPVSPAPRRGSSDSHTPCPVVASCWVAGSQDWGERSVPPPWPASRRPQARRVGEEPGRLQGRTEGSRAEGGPVPLGTEPAPLASAAAAGSARRR